MIGSSISQALAEGLSLGVKAGAEPRMLWECVRRGMVGRMHVLHYQVPQTVFRGRFETETFPLKLLRKDIGLATDLGRELNVPLPMANIAEQVLIEAINRGWGDQAAYTVAFQLQEEAAQVQIRTDGVDPERAAKYISTHPDEG
jgi:3-hydroxyisobutyrate dehydrogenase